MAQVHADLFGAAVPLVEREGFPSLTDAPFAEWRRQGGRSC
jgi:hypothetical protein